MPSANWSIKYRGTCRMKIIYHCYGRAHSSVVASQLHLGNLPMVGPVTKEAIMAIPEFDLAEAADWGEPYLVGRDTA
ncbi:MAG TPA: hypothetical protein DDZ55_00610, partial [Firmicutes bacterium]|nr:hypothetical protein [Bacillota bacterium]